MTDPRRDDSPSVDAEHPWIGLASFTESTRTYFHGRDNEITELCRRIQRKPLTVLFGKSGLGKTSILQAGVVPRLRDQGYCPVYLRIDYAADAPSAAEQIKQAIVKAAEQSGRWTRAGVAEGGESLWAFLHHRDDVLLDSAGQALLPLLIFDQFEEIFTLAQADEQGRERAAAFTADLAELVENRPPAALDALLENDDSAYERYDLARADYRVVVSLREDYLAHLEGLKAAMPSITQNRLRLAPMMGAQALSAIIEPGRHLVNDEVAAAIVRFVAGGAEVAHAEVEPSLLSLICRELNDQRIALGRSEIGADLLAGSHTSILGEFYERSIADQPAGVRTFIEDHLLTDSGYRENVAEERVRSEFSAAGAHPEALALLVNRRLLRIEERLDLRRVELTHDVLCAVVRASRDQRREREALEASARLAVDQSERARLAQRALARARAVAAVCVLLAVSAVAASGYAFVSYRHAQQAESDAQSTRARAEQLMGYLQNDLANELEPVAHLDLTMDLNDRVVRYFEGLPADQRTPASERNRAVALINQAHSLDFQGRDKEAAVAVDAAVALLEPQFATGHPSEAGRADLALALRMKADLLLDGGGDSAQGIAIFRRAASLLQATVAGGHGLKETRMAFATIKGLLCSAEATDARERAYALDDCSAARQVYADLGAMSLTDARVSKGYLWSSALRFAILNGQGRSQSVLTDAPAVADMGRRLLVRYPNYSFARQMLYTLESYIGDAHVELLELQEASIVDGAAASDLSALAKADPGNVYVAGSAASAHAELGQLAMEQGNPSLALDHYREAAVLIDPATKNPEFLLDAIGIRSASITAYADLGDDASATAILGQANSNIEAYGKLSLRPAQFVTDLFECEADWMQAQLTWIRHDDVRAHEVALARLTRLDASPSTHDDQDHARCRSQLSYLLARTFLRSGDAPAAETRLRRAIQVFKAQADQSTLSLRYAAELETWLALAQIRQGHADEARATLAPVLALQRKLSAMSSQSATQRLELASALYVQALTGSGSQRKASLSEAMALIDRLPAPMRALRSVQMWQDWIRQARASSNDRAGAAHAARQSS